MMRLLCALTGCLALAACGLAGTAASTAAGAASEAQQASQARQTEDKVREQIKDAAAVDAAQRERAEKDAQ
jgi:hypothetical protein